MIGFEIVRGLGRWVIAKRTEQQETKFSNIYSDLSWTGQQILNEYVQKSSFPFTVMPATGPDAINGYDSANKILYIKEKYLADNSLAAIAIVAHTLSHVQQDRTGYWPAKILLQADVLYEKLNRIIGYLCIGSVICIALLLAGIFLKMPVLDNLLIVILILLIPVGVLFVVGLVLSRAFGLVMEIFAFLVEHNATSFALKWLSQNSYLTPQDFIKVKTFLREYREGRYYKGTCFIKSTSSPSIR